MDTDLKKGRENKQISLNHTTRGVKDTGNKWNKKVEITYNSSASKSVSMTQHLLSNLKYIAVSQKKINYIHKKLTQVRYKVK